MPITTMTWDNWAKYCNQAKEKDALKASLKEFTMQQLIYLKSLVQNQIAHAAIAECQKEIADGALDKIKTQEETPADYRSKIPAGAIQSVNPKERAFFIEAFNKQYPTALQMHHNNEEFAVRSALIHTRSIFEKRIGEMIVAKQKQAIQEREDNLKFKSAAQFKTYQRESSTELSQSFNTANQFITMVKQSEDILTKNNNAYQRYYEQVITRSMRESFADTPRLSALGKVEKQQIKRAILSCLAAHRDRPEALKKSVQQHAELMLFQHKSLSSLDISRTMLEAIEKTEKDQRLKTLKTSYQKSMSFHEKSCQNMIKQYEATRDLYLQHRAAAHDALSACQYSLTAKQVKAMKSDLGKTHKTMLKTLAKIETEVTSRPTPIGIEITGAKAMYDAVTKHRIVSMSGENLYQRLIDSPEAVLAQSRTSISDSSPSLTSSTSSGALTVSRESSTDSYLPESDTGLDFRIL